MGSPVAAASPGAWLAARSARAAATCGRIVSRALADHEIRRAGGGGRRARRVRIQRGHHDHLERHHPAGQAPRHPALRRRAGLGGHRHRSRRRHPRARVAALPGQIRAQARARGGAADQRDLHQPTPRCHALGAHRPGRRRHDEPRRPDPGSLPDQDPGHRARLVPHAAARVLRAARGARTRGKVQYVAEQITDIAPPGRSWSRDRRSRATPRPAPRSSTAGRR